MPMTEYPCPVCGRRVCDSYKALILTACHTDKDGKDADVLIKCKGCKSILEIKIDPKRMCP